MDVEKYLYRGKQSCDEEMFLSVNYALKEGQRHTFFKDMNLAEINLPGYMERACNNIDMKGDGLRNRFTAHGIRET